MVNIVSLKNPQVKLAGALRQKRDRDKTSFFLVEGYKELLFAERAKVGIKSLFICPDLFLKKNEGTLIEKIRERGAKILVCSKRVFEKISYRDRPDGLLAIAYKMELRLSQVGKLDRNLFIVVAESIEKPGNLGTILRSSDATGVDLVIVADPKTDIYNPNVVRASLGTLFTQRVALATSKETISFLKQHKVKIVASTPAADKLFTEEDLKSPVAILVGTEQYGLSFDLLEESDVKVRIPMLGEIDSLNVASATTLLLYEVVRQRSLLNQIVK